MSRRAVTRAFAFAWLLLFQCSNWMQPGDMGASRKSLHGEANPSKSVRNMHANRNYVSEESDLIKEATAVTKTALRRRMALRKPLPERLTLIFPNIEGVEEDPQDARLTDFNVGDQNIEVSLAGGSMKLVEKHASLWRVEASDTTIPLGTLVQVYDTTPNAKAPSSAQTSGAVKTSVLQKSGVTRGGLAWNGMAGFSLENSPRDFDGVHVAFTVWDCASGICNMLQEGEDAKALVCEFGALRRGLSDMIPGESRRFWIPGDVKDRRFGRPAPETGLPQGDLVVDLTLLGIQREAVFDYKLSDEQIKLGQMRERSPAVVVQRALGIGIQLGAWAWVYSYYQAGQDMDMIGFSHSVHL